MSLIEIKKAIQNWRDDNNRVQYINLNNVLY